MNTAPLGRTGVRVSRLCLGTGALDFPADEQGSIKLVGAALDAGINFIDTADIYGQGQSEEIVGAALRGRRDEVFLTTKFWAPMGPGPNDGGVSRRWILRAVEDSLRRLQTDYIDLYQQHRPEYGVDLDEVLGAMSDLVRAGKVRYIGASTFPAEMIVEAEWIADRRSRERFVCHEVPYAILVRSVEATVLPTCQRFGTGVITYSPLAGGWLGGRHRRDSGVQQDTHWAQIVPERFDPSRSPNDRKLHVVDELAKIAADAGLSMPHLAVAWILEHPAVTSVILGPRNPEQLATFLPAVETRLDHDILDCIDALVEPGTTVDPFDDQWTPATWPRNRSTVYPRLPALEPSSRRRAR
jgi:aryl-alcohol dehydrogenase-like predicted oxidoreductase